MKQLVDTPSFVRHVVAVDPAMEDFAVLSALGLERSIHVTLTPSGLAALRLAPSFGDALWLVSCELPDMNGLRLLTMLTTLQPDLDVQLIDVAYDRQQEQEALRLGANHYRCKPVDPFWVAAWIGKRW